MTMRWQANVALLVTASIWGLAFVAQRVGMEYLEPFTFNGIRFLLGALSLLPILWWQQHRKPVAKEALPSFRVFGIGVVAGLILFLAASLQQIGIVDTTAGKAAFVTSLYIVLVSFERCDFRAACEIFFVVGMFAITSRFVLSLHS